MAAASAVETRPNTSWQPRTPETLEEAGLSAEFVEELLLKVLYVHGARSRPVPVRSKT